MTSSISWPPGRQLARYSHFRAASAAPQRENLVRPQPDEIFGLSSSPADPVIDQKQEDGADHRRNEADWPETVGTSGRPAKQSSQVKGDERTCYTDRHRY
jgi:hypothetical protein